MAKLLSGAADEAGFLSRLENYCDPVQFDAGSLLREKGRHYTSMYLITEGEVEVDLGFESGKLRPRIEGLGLPIGEIGFLRGYPATAAVTALSDVRALEIDDAKLSVIERDDAELAVRLLQFLGRTADERTSHNITLSKDFDDAPKEQSIRILLCRDPDMLSEAKRLRYEVYCRELGRQSPHADHNAKTISDELDTFGHTFIAVEVGEAIGTLRANRPAEGPIGILETLYGMASSPFNPESTIVCTKFIIAKHRRTSTAGIKLVAAFARFSLQSAIRECYIDCIPSLRAYYMAIGFRSSGEKFLHRENGPSFPMMIDLVKYKRRIERVLLTAS